MGVGRIQGIYFLDLSILIYTDPSRLFRILHDPSHPLESSVGLVCQQVHAGFIESTVGSKGPLGKVLKDPAGLQAKMNGTIVGDIGVI